MSLVTAQYAWSDGTTATFEVEIENDYPDALAEARATVVRGLAEVVAGMAVEDE